MNQIILSLEPNSGTKLFGSRDMKTVLQID